MLVIFLKTSWWQGIRLPYLQYPDFHLSFSKKERENIEIVVLLDPETNASVRKPLIAKCKHRTVPSISESALPLSFKCEDWDLSFSNFFQPSETSDQNRTLLHYMIGSKLPPVPSLTGAVISGDSITQSFIAWNEYKLRRKENITLNAWMPSVKSKCGDL